MLAGKEHRRPGRALDRPRHAWFQPMDQSPSPKRSDARRGRCAHAALLVVSVASLAALLTLRVYAAWQLPSVHTPWDDDSYRAAAGVTARRVSALQTARNLVLPHTGLVMDGRINGYNDWLAAAIKVRRALGRGSNEVAFQTVNAVMLMLQSLAVLLFARWALKDRALAWAFAFLYVSAPVVFGTSRWVHAENLVLLAGVVLSGLAAWLLGRTSRLGLHPRYASLMGVGLAAWGIGLCTRAREYAAPSFLVLFLCVEIVLLVRRRWLEAGVVAVVTAAFMVPWVPAVAEAARVFLGKAGEARYFFPLAEWIPHVSFYTVGPAFAVLLLTLGSLVLYQRSRRVLRLLCASKLEARFLCTELSGVRPLVWSHLFLFVFYAAGFFCSRNRVTRAAIPMMLAGLGLVLIGVRTLPPLRASLQRAPAKLAALALIAMSWSVLIYQLAFAFEGGKTYAHAGFRLEYFNYPLRLRPLTGPSDSYICIEDCPYDQR
jgi:hypothetical protein